MAGDLAIARLSWSITMIVKIILNGKFSSSENAVVENKADKKEKILQQLGNSRYNLQAYIFSLLFISSMQHIFIDIHTSTIPYILFFLIPEKLFSLLIYFILHNVLIRLLLYMDQ